MIASSTPDSLPNMCPRQEQDFSRATSALTAKGILNSMTLYRFFKGTTSVVPQMARLKPGFSPPK
jgi:hypothetical protein